MSDNAGRLKKTLGRKCPIDNFPLQVRVRETNQLVRGENKIIEEDYVRCSNLECEYEEEIEQKKRKERIDKAFYFEEPPDSKKDWRNNKDGYNKRHRATGRTNGSNKGGYGNRNGSSSSETKTTNRRRHSRRP